MGKPEPSKDDVERKEAEKDEDLIKALESLTALEFKALDDKDYYIRIVTMKSLGEIGDRRAVEPLIEALKDERGGVRKAAAAALGRLKDKRAVEPLIEVLKENIKSIPLQLLKEIAVRALGKINDPKAIEPLIQTLKDRNHYFQREAVEVLVKFGDKAVEPLIRALKDENTIIRIMAAKVLGKIKDKRAVEPLTRALKDENWGVREAAGWALREIEEPVEPLIPALKDKEPRVRIERQLSAMHDLVLRVVDFLENHRVSRYDELDYRIIEFVLACRVLEVIGDPVAIPTLVNLLEKYGENQHLSDRYRIKAVTGALMGIGAEAVQLLAKLLKSRLSETRKFAAYALGKIGDKSVFPALAKLIRDPDIRVREAAGRALMQIYPQRAEKMVETDIVAPREDARFNRLAIDLDLEVINQYCGSLDSLGSPSDYRLSVTLFDYVLKAIRFFVESRNFKECEEEKEEGEEDIHQVFARKLDLPREIVDEIVKMDNHFLLCICGEYLKWGYVKSISKRVYEIEDSLGWHFITRDIMCVYCENCKRYTGLTRDVDDAHPGYIDFYRFYLPRFPKPDELITEEELETKEPILIKWEGPEF
ncbi:MAG: HEAT repeat domain-containing protein [Candidatus Lokiarchaeia archaeon]